MDGGYQDARDSDSNKKHPKHVDMANSQDSMPNHNS